MQQITNTRSQGKKNRSFFIGKLVDYFRHLFFAEAYIYRIWFPFICWSFRRLFGFYPLPYRNDLSL